jgi:hypothetical protein
MDTSKKCNKCNYAITSNDWNFCPGCSAKISNTCKISFRFIADRQFLIEETKLRQLGLDAFMFDRLDMYWIEVQTPKSGIKHISFSVDPEYNSATDKISWSIAHQYGDHSDTDYQLARKAFKGTEEEQNLFKWTRNLVEGEYFSKGRWGCPDTSPCKFCKSTYKNGTTHEHLMYNNKIVAHSGKKYKKIQELGYKVSWSPGSAADEPSLEDLNQLPS